VKTAWQDTVVDVFNIIEGILILCNLCRNEGKFNHTLQNLYGNMRTFCREYDFSIGSWENENNRIDSSFNPFMSQIFPKNEVLGIYKFYICKNNDLFYSHHNYEYKEIQSQYIKDKLKKHFETRIKKFFFHVIL